MMPRVLVPVHPEAVPGDDSELRWVIPAGILNFVGNATTVPPDLRELIADGTVESMIVESTAVRTRLVAGHTWRRDGARVRAALQAGLATPHQWSTTDAGSPDDVLRMAVQNVIGGEVGDYVRSHGGLIELLDVTDGHVQVRLTGACAHCPSANITLDERFETAVRARYPDLRSVTARPAPGLRGGRFRLPLTVKRSDR